MIEVLFLGTNSLKTHQTVGTNDTLIHCFFIAADLLELTALNLHILSGYLI